jgi:hypothetical protein
VLVSRTQLLHIASEIVGQPLLILPEKLGVIASVLGERIGIDDAALELGPMPDASRFVGRRRDPETNEFAALRPHRGRRRRSSRSPARWSIAAPGSAPVRA